MELSAVRPINQLSLRLTLNRELLSEHRRRRKKKSSPRVTLDVACEIFFKTIFVPCIGILLQKYALKIYRFTFYIRGVENIPVGIAQF